MRAVIKAKTVNGTYMAKMTKDLLSEEESVSYHKIYDYLMENYEIKEFVADQLALLKVYQMYYVWPNGGDITVTSEMMRKWAVEEKLTEKSKDKDITNITNMTFGVLVERLAKEIDVEVVDNDDVDVDE